MKFSQRCGSTQTRWISELTLDFTKPRQKTASIRKSSWSNDIVVLRRPHGLEIVIATNHLLLFLSQYMTERIILLELHVQIHIDQMRPHKLVLEKQKPFTVTAFLLSFLK